MAEINPEYERGFKDGLKSKIGEELQPMIAQVLEGVSEAIKGLIPRMIDIMEIKAKLDANDWIPCSERLPEVGIPVLIYDKHHKAFFVAKLDEDYFGFSSNMWHHPADVPFWMPFPELPKEGESDA